VKRKREFVSSRRKMRRHRDAYSKPR